MHRFAWMFVGLAGIAGAQSPIVSPTTVPTFTYTMYSSTLPTSQTVKVTLPAAVSTLPIAVGNVVVPSNPCPVGVPPPCGWLAVTPDQGHAPLTLTVSVNPTGLTPGSYPGSFQVDTIPSSGSPVTVAVNLQISNPPSTLLLTSNSPNFTPGASSSASSSLNFSYTTGGDSTTLATSELDISSTGDIVPFNVTAANSKGSGTSTGTSSAVWLRVSSKSPTQGAALTTSGSAGEGSMVPIFVTLDYTTLQGLGIGTYAATITVAAAKPAVNGSITVLVSLVVSAGPPTVAAVFPQSSIPTPPVNPVFTIYGTNFTLNTSVTLNVGASSVLLTPIVLVSSKVLQVTVPATDLPTVVAPNTYPFACGLTIRNAGFPAVTGTFQLTDPTAPNITQIANAASYLPISKFTGTASNPAAAPNPQTAVSPRGVISIFGQNLGPTVVSTAVPVPPSPPSPSYYSPNWGGFSVSFTYLDPTAQSAQRTAQAAILMVSLNQINVIVPSALGVLAGTANPTATVTVTNGTLTSTSYPVTVIAEDPGIFTFGGLGQGQGAIIDYDASGAATLNSSSNAEPRGNIIAIYATGLGEMDPTIPDGAITSSSAAGTPLLDQANVRVSIGGQPAVVLYAGTSPGAVAGLVQVNVVVPPTSSTGTTLPLTLSIGDKTVARQAQNGVTVAVK